MPTTPTELLLTDMQQLLKPRERTAYKGDFGHVLVIGGDYGMAGAVRMAGEAAARCGAGLVSIATRPEHAGSITSARPELMVHGIVEVNDLQPLLDRATALILGPGLGRSAWSYELYKYCVTIQLPKVVDADALYHLAEHHVRRYDWILTPHVGEAARLLQCTTKKIQDDRIQSIQDLQQVFGGVVVLKGAGTLVLGNNRQPKICNAGNPGMATGGMGDVLSGVIGSLLAQKLSVLQAAELGVCIHATAGDLAAKDGGERGMLALDLMPYLRKLVNPK